MIRTKIDMSGVSKDHTSTGGKSNNIFNTSEQEQAQANKKNHMSSNIFGFNDDNDVQKSSRSRDYSGSNIFGGKDETNQVAAKSSTIPSDKNKSNIFDGPQQQPQTTKPVRNSSDISSSQNETNEINHTNNTRTADLHRQNQMRSNIFDTNDQTQKSTAASSFSDKNKSNIFNDNENDQKKRGGRQGVRVGYNCITGESYNTNKGPDSNNEKKQHNDQVQTANDVHDQDGVNKNDTKQNLTDHEKLENGNTTKTSEHDSGVNGSSRTNGETTANGNEKQQQQQAIHTSSRIRTIKTMMSNGTLDNEMYSPFQQPRFNNFHTTPPRVGSTYYNNSSYSQPTILTRDSTLGGNSTSTNNSAYLTDLHSQSVKYPLHNNNIISSSRLAHIGNGLYGGTNSLGLVSSHADVAATSPRNMSPENLDFYPYSQHQIQITEDDLLASNSTRDEKERTAPPDSSYIRHVKPDFSYFMSDELRAEILRRNQMLTACTSLDVASAIPERVGDYYNLTPLDSSQANVTHKSRTFRYQTISYKATHIRTNAVCYLKRIMGCKLPTTRQYEICETWKKLAHANIVQLRDVFLTKDFEDEQTWTTQAGLLAEALIWEYVVQISSLIRTIHSANLSCRCLHLSRLLVDGDSKVSRAKSRIWLSGVGIADILDVGTTGQTHSSLVQHQQNDLQDFGRLVLMLACNSIVGAQKEHLQTSLDIVHRNYSLDLKNLIIHFLSLNNRPMKNINDVMPMIGARFYAQIDSLYVRGDIVENELSKEIDCGRLFRLICKLDALLERPEHALNQAWSETGDRYILKLFRDYVFHGVGFNGEPILDLAHIVQCLNKFDSGSHEKICLTSRDEQNVMIVSYSELHQAFERAFSELMNYGTSTS
ncbi:unnamed protein product [Didymodactylos carnosus]|uniref:Pan3 C-terminal knob domain-containing protein n=1 Tax=Didymodactylos carnosus TaxID=1234261 RepID=A0A814CLS2_9BILA|nr:unnamed protein product [Didymodactylos carnosus]CAF0943925.1 unnamed protein product [Didymodactylos carnosus]CAF3500453.1 unnamed protein product [Didymodactylos carnosus]CAF3720190.1 unnamed protein product [Didymodactylos carnosus]